MVDKVRVRRVFRRNTKLIIGSLRDFSETPVIFLDVDGVLNSGQHAYMVNRRSGKEWSPYRDEACQIAISNLTEVIDEVPKTHIVVSSTWRKATSITHLRYIFNLWGFKYTKRIVAKTPVIHRPGADSFPRGKEVAWFCRKFNVKNYVIIDDDRDFYKYQWKRCVFTDNYHGFMLRDALKAIKILKGE